MEDLDDWTTVLAAQAGIVTRRQLLGRGITDDTIRAHVAAGRWVPVHDGVYATAGVHPAGANQPPRR